MVARIVMWLLEVLLNQIKPETLRKLSDKALDLVENWADAADKDFVLKVTEIIRDAFNIEDND